jgi:integrase
MEKGKLTKRLIESAASREKDYELRDAETHGFLCKITPAGNKVFMVQYRTVAGVRRKPKVGLFGELTVEQAREIAKGWLAEVRKGGDPSASRTAARIAPTMVEFGKQFMDDYVLVNNKPRTVKDKQGYLDRYIIPVIGSLKVADVTRADITKVLARLSSAKRTSDLVLACLNKMFNMAEVWLLRSEGTNPCRLLKKYNAPSSSYCFTDEEMQKIYGYLHRAETLGLEHPTLILASRLQFEFAGRQSEIIGLEWAWVNFAERRIEWPDSKTGSMNKVMSDEAFRLLSNAYRHPGSPYVCPAIFDPMEPLSWSTHYHAWQRLLKRAGVQPRGTHAVRHRAATEIANTVANPKDGMAMTGHRSIAMYLRYVHPDEKRIKKSADKVSAQRRKLVGTPSPVQFTAANPSTHAQVATLTAQGNYRPYRKRKGANREAPPDSRSTISDADMTASETTFNGSPTC